MNVYIGKPVVISDMQGPCPDGFHVPLQSESAGLKTIMDGLGLTTGDDWRIKLHIPFAGYRAASDASAGAYNTIGYYCSSSHYTGSINVAYIFAIASSSISITFDSRSNGHSIRAFKNEFVTPTSSWTVINGTLGSAGIFWNQTEGLISITSDGTTGYTIQDKNLGATTVYNDGDTLTDANCGNVYQRGNNYGFPGALSSTAITKSSTQINVTGYGPGNYYSSSTWITTNPRQSSANDGNNLRGGVSQGSTTKDVELKNAYIGEYVPPYLCFTANTANSTVKLMKYNSPTSVTLETSTDGTNWSTYSFGTTKTLSNIGDKIYFRNTSETDTGFTIDASSYYLFIMTGSIAGSGNITSLLNKNFTTTLSTYCFYDLFDGCSALTTAPEIPVTQLGDYCCYMMFFNCSSLTNLPTLSATTLKTGCYSNMFFGCSNLEKLPKLPATTLVDSCYRNMFSKCTNIKLSTTQTGNYQTPYRIPTTGTGTNASDALVYMFSNTGGTFTGTPSINTTYYTSNTVV